MKQGDKQKAMDAARILAELRIQEVMELVYERGDDIGLARSGKEEE